MQGQATHFQRYAPEKSDYSLTRYINECRRLYQVLDDQLSSSRSGFLVGDRCTIADLAHYGWIACASWTGLDINEFPHLKKWESTMEARPAIQKARSIPNQYDFKSLAASKSAAEEFAEAGRKWFKENLKGSNQSSEATSKPS